MKRITNWIKKTLGITRIEEENKALKGTVANQSDMLMQLNKHIDNIEEKFQIGVDISMHPGDSWAVICIEGKQQDTVRFMALGSSEIREIEKFLRQFDRNRRMMDTPMQYFPVVRDMKWRS